MSKAEVLLSSEYTDNDKGALIVLRSDFGVSRGLYLLKVSTATIQSCNMRVCKPGCLSTTRRERVSENIWKPWKATMMYMFNTCAHWCDRCLYPVWAVKSVNTRRIFSKIIITVHSSSWLLESRRRLIAQYFCTVDIFWESNLGSAPIECECQLWYVCKQSKAIYCNARGGLKSWTNKAKLYAPKIKAGAMGAINCSNPCIFPPNCRFSINNIYLLGYPIWLEENVIWLCQYSTFPQI